MTRGAIFWFIMIFLVVFGCYGFYAHGFHPATGGMTLVTWVLFALLGWQVFGPAVKG
jgi:hypothetical protein